MTLDPSILAALKACEEWDEDMPEAGGGILLEPLMALKNAVKVAAQGQTQQSVPLDLSGMVALVVVDGDVVREVVCVPESQAKATLTKLRIQYMKIPQVRIDEWRRDYEEAEEDDISDDWIVHNIYEANIEDGSRLTINRADRLTVMPAPANQTESEGQ